MEELRVSIACCPDHKAQKRLNAIHLMLCGGSFELTRAHSAVSERCLQLWIKCFNKAGIDGITYRPKSGRPRLMESEEINAKILPVVDNPQCADRYHWTAVSLCGWLKDTEKMEISYRTLVRYLHEQDYARRIPRPVPEPPDRDAWLKQREDFVPKLKELLNDEQVEVFFGDEAGFEGDPRPRQRWVKRGSRPTQGYYGGHVRQNIVGAVNPKSGQLVSLIVPHCDTEVFQAFLDTMAKETEEQKQEKRRVVLVLDNASWHKTKRLIWHHIEPVYLPPYSPDFNPIERIWQYLKGHGMAGYLSNKGAELCEKLFQEVKSLLNDPETIRSVSTVNLA
jgi:transposase